MAGSSHSISYTSNEDDNLTKLENEIELDESSSITTSSKRCSKVATLRGKKRKIIGKDKAIHVGETSGSVSETTDEFGTDDIAVTHIKPSASPDNSSVQATQDHRSFLTLIVHQNILGAAHYDTENCVMRVYKEISESLSFTNCLNICLNCYPDKIIVNAKQSSNLIDAINAQYFNDSEGTVEIVSSSLFMYETAKRRLQSLPFFSQSSAEFTDQQKDIWTGSVLDFGDKNSIKAAGALLRYIDQNRVGFELEESFIQAPILSISQVAVPLILNLDTDTFLALQIFQDESHPSMAKRGSSSSRKEGLSLFGQMDLTKSKLGSIKLKHWFKTPSKDVRVINERQEAIGYFALNENFDKVVAINDCLKNIKSLTKIIAKMHSSHISVHDWNIFYKTLYNSICIFDLCNSLENGIETIELIQKADFSNLREILAMITKIMDFEESKQKNRFVVKHGIDKELDEKKRVFSGLPELMTKVAEQELSGLDDKILECNVIYLPQLGYLLAIPHYPFIKEADGYPLRNLEFMFLSNGTLYYKSDHTKELDRLLGDTQSEICDHESGIMHRLQNTILQHVDLIIKALDFSAQLDCIISIASFAKDNNLVFPKMTANKEINIYGGRHILHEMCSHQFVSNDSCFNQNDGFMKVVSGPNACGKSVYLKQTALIVYMAHLGAPVPADQAEICVCDSIFTRIKCVESVSINLSTFVLDLNQITKAVNRGTGRSLIVVDEFGKGTSQHDGVALYTAVLKHWLSKGKDCPFILAATHYHSIFKLKLLPPSPFVKFKTFDVISDDNGIVYLYKLVDGYCLRSQANHVAKVAGLKDAIIRRAEDVLELTSKQKSITSLWKCDKKHIEIVKMFMASNFEHVSGFKLFERELHKF